MKKTINILLIVLLISVQTTIFAVDDEESIDYIWLQEIVEAAKDNKEPKIYSKSVVAYDRDSKLVLYGKNENERVPMASTTKIMTAILLTENVNLNQEVEVTKEAAMVGGSSLELKTGDKLTYEALLYGLMLCSGNDAATQIAISMAGSVEDFADLMNEKAQELGLENTHFITPHGLDEDEHYTTAYELAKITDYALTIPKIAEVVSTKTYTITINGYPKTLSNTNELLGYLEGVNGVKTGFTSKAGRCLVTSVIRDGFNIITVVLGADTKKTRTKDSINLIEYIYGKYELVDLTEQIEREFENWQRINKKRIKIIKGIYNTVGAEIEEYKYKKYPVEKEKIEKIQIKSIARNLNIEAPVSKKCILGNLEVLIDGEKLMDIKIQTEEAIMRKGIKEYFRELIGNYY